MKDTAERLVAVYQQRNQKHMGRSAGDELATAVQNLQLELNLGNLYLSMGDLDAARGLAPKIIQQIRAAKWRPSLEFESAAVLLARMGRDEEAFEIVNRYDQFFETRPESEEDRSNTHFWIYRASVL